MPPRRTTAKYAKPAYLQSIYDHDRASFTFFVDYVTEFLEDSCLTLPETLDPVDESKWESRIRDDSINEILESLLHDRCDSVSLPQSPYKFLNQLVYWVYATGFLNRRVRHTYQSANYYLAMREQQLLDSGTAKRYPVPQLDRSISSHTHISAGDLKNASTNFTIETVLDHLLHVVRKRHTEQYSTLIDSQIDLRAVLLSHLRIPHYLFDDGVPTTHDQIKAIGGNIAAPRPGVYLHCIGTHMYVGQAIDLYRRIVLQHQSLSYRVSSPSRHYRVWQQLPEAEHTWVVLADDAPSDESENRALVLNLLEMLGCLIFQTLPAEALDVYLDPSIKRTVNGTGLNIALPLNQGQTSSGVPIQHLRLFEDPRRRQYYIDTLKRGSAACHTTALKQAIVKYVDGVDVVLAPVVYANPKRVTTAVVAVRHVSREIFKVQMDALGIEWGDTVTVTVEMNATTPHDFAFALDAKSEDPAKRLAIRLTSRPGKFIYIHSKGDRQVWRANSLADEFEGVDEETSRGSPRRWFTPESKNNKYLTANQ